MLIQDQPHLTFIGLSILCRRHLFRSALATARFASACTKDVYIKRPRHLRECWPHSADS